jgi:muramoyltetrapeptide carboxypeptidase LdcA involved in peptidoglycan recycling
MPVVANMDFGHTSPPMVVPIGCRPEIEPQAKRIVVLESAVA